MPRTCTVCRHPKRIEIDAALVEHLPFRTIARQFSASKDALIRHHDNHLPAELTKAKEAGDRRGAQTPCGYEAGRDVTNAAIPLNGRQELFAQEYAITGNGTQSAITAGYSAKTAYSIASRLLKNVKVAARIKQLQSKAAERAVVTMESIAQQLDDDRFMARADRKAGAAIAATMGKAKLYGLITDKVAATITPVRVTEAGARQKIQEIFGAPTNGAGKPKRL